MGARVPGRPSRLALLRAGAASALVAAVTLTSAGLADASTIGPDISSHNHDNRARVNFSVMHRVGGAAFIFVKATEGTDYVNPRFASDFRRARRLMVRGAYHYARPSGVTFPQIAADATAEADFFIQATGTMEGMGILPPVLDLEDAGALNPTQLSRWAHTWLRRVKELTGRTPMVYTNGHFWRLRLRNSKGFRSYGLWLASYGVTAPAVPGRWKRYTFWQYTDRGNLAGAGLRLDLSVFNGSRAQLQALTLRTVVSPETSRASGRPRTPVRSRTSVTSAVPSRALVASEASARSMTSATLKYINRVRDADSESRPLMWPNVFGRGGILRIGR